MAERIDGWINRNISIIVILFGIGLAVNTVYTVAGWFQNDSIITRNKAADKRQKHSDSLAALQREKISGTTDSLKQAIYNYKHTK